MNRFALAALLAPGLMLPGCTSAPAAKTEPNPSLRPIAAPANATAADTDRAALARFVGAWNFEGWAAGQGGAKQNVTGRAAATIEREHFVLLDLQVTSGQLSGRAARKSGSLLFASEPGIGLTLTAWGDASPAISRLLGTSRGNASGFNFNEVKTAAGTHRVSLDIAFQTDDQWTAEIRDRSASGQPVIATYRFTRARP